MINRLAKSTPFMRFLAGVVSFFLSWGLWSVIFSSPLIAGVIMISVFIHELCHHLAFRLYGVKSAIIFMFLGASTYPLNIQKLEEKLLSETMWVLPAGIIANICLGWAALYFGGANPIWVFVAMINFFLAFFNLAPHSTMDGGKIVVAVTYLFREKRSEAANWLIIIAESVAVLGFTNFVGVFADDIFVQFLVIFLFGSDLILRLIGTYRKHNEPMPQGLSTGQAVYWAMLYTTLLFLSLGGLILIPTPIF